MDRLLTSKQSLSEALRMRGVVPVLGPEAVLVEIEDSGVIRAAVPFYQLVADELLSTYGTSLPPQHALRGHSPWLLHRAVSQVMADCDDTSPERLRRSVTAIINSVSTRARSALLARLAALRAFDLFICLTPDDCFVEALRQVLGADNVEVSAYAPNADTSRPVDVSPARAGAARVFFPLGRSATGTRLAMHEEDALEYIYKFQEDSVRRAPNLLTELRSRDLLLLGCNLPDWLGRGFLRLANESRLSSQDKKMEFFAADAQDPALNSFLSRFDPNASVFPWSPEEFVTELESMVKPVASTAETAAPMHGATEERQREGASTGPTLFVSYASEDAEAVRRLAQSLAGAGFGDVWLDKRKLIAGDDWSDRIDEAIEQCDFFMPVLSRQADQRREGVFWEEWRKALMRAMRVHDAFLLPVGIDATQPDRAGYDRIFNGFTAGFRRLNLLHAPDGALSQNESDKLRKRCGLLGEVRGA